MTLLKASRLVLARRLSRFIRRTLAGDIKGEASRHLICIGFLRLAISFKYFSRAFSFDKVRYNWPLAFGFIKGGYNCDNKGS